MESIKRLSRAVCAALAAVAATACTPGAVAPPSSSGGLTTAVIDVNLTTHAPASSPFGLTGGYAPAQIAVAVGSTIRFVNSDGFAHTATLVPGSTFPAGSPLGTSAQTQSGSVVTDAWSTGTLPAGSSSQTITINRAGTYLYGCFFHYGAPMRGAIVAQ